MRILEFGPVPFVKSLYPDATTFVGTGFDVTAPVSDTAFDFALRRIPRLLELQRSRDFDVVFVTRQASQRDAIGPTALIRILTNRRVWKRRFPLTRTFGDRMLRFGCHAPVVLFDPSDAPFMPKHAFWIWHRATAIFKRELPLDHWRMFMRTAHPDVPTPRFRKRSAYRDIVNKVRPMSLGLSPQTEAAIPNDVAPKQTDIFFAGLVETNSSIRQTGIRELVALRDRGWTIDLAENRLPHEEFYRRCAQARLVWSPAGLGHDAFRHYEAAACGSVPLISRPSIHQYAPFRHGESAVFYDPEPGGLLAAAEQALERPDDLTANGLRARAHALTHHSARARVDHMLSAVLERSQI